MKKLLYIFILIFGFTACKTRYIEIPKVHTEYVTKSYTQHDTVHITDSIWIRERGDTVFVDRVRYKDKTSIVNKTDTVLKTDSIPIYVSTEKNLSLKQKAYVIIGKCAVRIIIIAILLFGILFIIRKTKIIRFIKTFL